MNNIDWLFNGTSTQKGEFETGRKLRKTSAFRPYFFSNGEPKFLWKAYINERQRQMAAETDTINLHILSLEGRVISARSIGHRVLGPNHRESLIVLLISDLMASLIQHIFPIKKMSKCMTQSQAFCIWLKLTGRGWVFSGYGSDTWQTKQSCKNIHSHAIN